MLLNETFAQNIFKLEHSSPSVIYRAFKLLCDWINVHMNCFLQFEVLLNHNQNLVRCDHLSKMETNFKTKMELQI